MNKRWGLNIDIEGFSNLYESGEDNQTKAISGLSELMLAIIQIGQKCYPGTTDSSERIFAHQFGDGFIIVSEFEEKDASRPIAIATSLMRHMLIKGYATKSAISIGSMTDINGCYPQIMRDSENGVLSLGTGLMTSIPVMGTALTKAHKLSSKASGSILIIDSSAFSQYPENLINNHEHNLLFIDWTSDDNDLSRNISNVSELEFGNQKEIHNKFQQYIALEPVPPARWVEGTNKSILK